MLTIKIGICGSSASSSEFIDAINELSWSVDPLPTKTLLGGFLIEENKSVLYIFALVDHMLPFKIPTDVWKKFNDDRLLGIIILIDSRKDVFHDRFLETQSLVHFMIQDQQMISLVGVESQNAPDTLPIEYIRTALEIPSEIPVVPCVATDKESVKQVLVALLDEVLKAMAAGKDV